MNQSQNDFNIVMNIIEENLTNVIEYKKLALLIGTSEYTMQRIFCFLTGMTLTEYIRKRRITKAAEELQKGNSKIIDIAIKYQYDSPISFTRTFQSLEGATPTQIRKGEKGIKVFPKLEFKTYDVPKEPMEFRIIKLEEQIFYGKTTKPIDLNDSKEISKLWKECKQDNTLDFIIEQATSNELYYGATEFLEKREKQKYYIMGKQERKDFEKLIIPKATWAAFKVETKEQKDILEVMNKIYNNWLPSSEYHIILPYPNLEIYYKDYCEYCIPVQ